MAGSPHPHDPRIADGVRPSKITQTPALLCMRAGAQASPLQCVPLADSCLALGAQVRRLPSPYPLCHAGMTHAGVADAPERAGASTSALPLQSCRRAIQMLNAAFEEGHFGAASDARVIYGQTDSLFVSFPSCSVIGAPCNVPHPRPVLLLASIGACGTWLLAARKRACPALHSRSFLFCGACDMQSPCLVPAAFTPLQLTYSR